MLRFQELQLLLNRTKGSRRSSTGRSGASVPITRWSPRATRKHVPNSLKRLAWDRKLPGGSAKPKRVDGTSREYAALHLLFSPTQCESGRGHRPTAHVAPHRPSHSEARRVLGYGAYGHSRHVAINQLHDRLRRGSRLVVVVTPVAPARAAMNSRPTRHAMLSLRFTIPSPRCQQAGHHASRFGFGARRPRPTLRATVWVQRHR